MSEDRSRGYSLDSRHKRFIHDANPNIPRFLSERLAFRYLSRTSSRWRIESGCVDIGAPPYAVPDGLRALTPAPS